MILSSERHDLAALDRPARAIAGPCRHQPLALFEQNTATVRLRDLAGDRVRQRLLGDLARKVRVLGAPIPERRSETVDRDLALHRFDEFEQRILGEPAGAAGLVSKHMLVARYAR